MTANVSVSPCKMCWQHTWYSLDGILKPDACYQGWRGRSAPLLYLGLNRWTGSLQRTQVIRVTSHKRTDVSNNRPLSLVCLNKDDMKTYTLLAPLWGESTGHRWIPLTKGPADSLHKGPVTLKSSTCHDVIILQTFVYFRRRDVRQIISGVDDVL